MSTSTLPKGAIVEFREQGEWHPYEITEANTTWHTGVCLDTVPQGTPIYRCVWKDGGTRLEVRSTRVKKTPATKTVVQWEAECQVRYDQHIAQQIETRRQFDAVCAQIATGAGLEEFCRTIVGAIAKGEIK